MSLQYYALNSIQSNNLFSTKTPVSHSSSYSLSSYVLKISGAWSLLCLHLSYQTHTITETESFRNIFCYVCNETLLWVWWWSVLWLDFRWTCISFLLFCFRFLIFPREPNKRKRVMTLFICSLSTHAWDIFHHHQCLSVYLSPFVLFSRSSKHFIIINHFVYFSSFPKSSNFYLCLILNLIFLSEWMSSPISMQNQIMKQNQK